MSKPIVYFLCTGNSCRSQIADGFLKALGGDKYDVRSAGLEAHGLNPRAVQVMQEAGIDISGHTSDVIDPDILAKADYIITLCGHANDNCPVVYNDKGERWHWGFEDPAKASGTEAEIMAKFCEVRDAIKDRIDRFVREGK
ncbi:arsenate reductase (thioredoxin) [Xylanibacillus composti]|uniref:Arsenate reductase n=1 Tax=Xylanibacillus composti TaxID=1572762 RepID=A0A8J4H6M1_9BACL|nr:arsenate reductase (thioredoxin) [Xylanibacillus composti]MDT9724060.1 arsenate reductase (thioredoxin) [Xylanibacillus composti]GIQ69453.1 arsenate reductase (thioredoxin) [Xylanibacillus composti]